MYLICQLNYFILQKQISDSYFVDAIAFGNLVSSFYYLLKCYALFLLHVYVRKYAKLFSLNKFYGQKRFLLSTHSIQPCTDYTCQLLFYKWKLMLTKVGKIFSNVFHITGPLSSVSKISFIVSVTTQVDALTTSLERTRA